MRSNSLTSDFVAMRFTNSNRLHLIQASIREYTLFCLKSSIYIYIYSIHGIAGLVMRSNSLTSDFVAMRFTNSNRLHLIQASIREYTLFCLKSSIYIYIYSIHGIAGLVMRSNSLTSDFVAMRFTNSNRLHLIQASIREYTLFCLKSSIYIYIYIYV